MNKYDLVMSIGSVCEYVYRKGVADAATCGDTFTIMEMANRDDHYTTLQFLTENFGRPLSYEHYKDFLVLFSSKIRSNELRGFLTFMRGATSLKKAICTVADYMYRRGLREGSGKSRESAMDYFLGYSKASKLERLDAPTQTKMQWIEEIKHTANNIYNTHNFYEIPTSMNKLSVFIGNSILESTRSEKLRLK